jgi:hypothetical protein
MGRRGLRAGRAVRSAFILFSLWLLASNHFPARGADRFPIPGIPYAPQHYVCGRAQTPPRIDGVLDDPAWNGASWTDPFTDIEGPLKPTPRFATRAKMIWDETHFYVGVEMEEPDLWATFTERDAVIYHENDFEVFIDPDWDTHAYYELEMNALNTVWDLLLLKPYRDGGPAVNGWDIAGLMTAVHLDGTLNHPGDRDRGWSVEIALPWKALAECAGRPAPPADRDQWRVNFSRVEWRLDVRNGGYEKSTDPGGKRSLPEDNWVWSPQGLVAMHYPEMWGVVQFSVSPPSAESANLYMPDPEVPARLQLWKAYYELKDHRRRDGSYPRELTDPHSRVLLLTTQSGFEATLPTISVPGILHIREDGRIWTTMP